MTPYIVLKIHILILKFLICMLFHIMLRLQLNFLNQCCSMQRLLKIIKVLYYIYILIFVILIIYTNLQYSVNTFKIVLYSSVTQQSQLNNNHNVKLKLIIVKKKLCYARSVFFGFPPFRIIIIWYINF